MPRRRTSQSVKHDVECHFEDKVYHGTYEIARGLLTVSWLHGSKSSTPGGAPEVLARIILRELVEEEAHRNRK